MDLTFAEQVKIVLSRKNMTIKQLAEEIQEKTGQKMSRQNLTQRLGRDNFQEQDMRMIAEILGCPFQLNILDAVEEEEGEIEYRPVKKRAGRKSAQSKEAAADKEQGGNDVTVGDMLDIMASVSEVRQAEDVQESGEDVQGEIDELMKEVISPDIEELKVPEEIASEETESEETGSDETETKEAEVPEEEAAASETESEDAQESAEEASAEPEVKTAAEAAVDSADSEVSTKSEQRIINADAQSKSVPKWEPKPEPKKVDRSGIWNRREEVIRKKKENHPHADWIGATPQSRSKDFMKDAAETGEINPYTGKEYETNSVRMHPKRIGYIQVYDRGNHKWTDMTEWAFLGFQEQKKSLLGSDYDEPIYLE
jgi:hypothetical protein